MQTLQPYLVFDGNCREAMTFYQSVLGGSLDLMTFADMPVEARPPAGEGDERIIHAYLDGGRATVMASDAMVGMTVTHGDAVSLYLSCGSDDEVAELYAGLVEGGTEGMAPHDAFWGARFAMLQDRFGNHWMLAHDKRAGA